MTSINFYKKLSVLGWVFWLSCFGATAQTSTKLPNRSDDEVKTTCRKSAPQLVEKVCSNDGSLNTIVLNFPSICQQYDESRSIIQALKSCNNKNSPFVEAWRLKFSQPNNMEKVFSDYIENIVKRESEQGASPITAGFEAFRLSVVACGRDARCHSRLFAYIAPSARDQLKETPFFCDYAQDGKLVFDGDETYRHLFLDKGGSFVQPVCKAYFCKYQTCNEEMNDANEDSKFILGTRFVPLYDRIYKGISND